MTNIRERTIKDMNTRPMHIILEEIRTRKHVNHGDLRNMRLSVCVKFPQSLGGVSISIKEDR